MALVAKNPINLSRARGSRVVVVGILTKMAERSSNTICRTSRRCPKVVMDSMVLKPFLLFDFCIGFFCFVS